MKVMIHAHHECHSPLEVIPETYEERLGTIKMVKVYQENPEQTAARIRLFAEVNVELPEELELVFAERSWLYAEQNRLYAEQRRICDKWDQLCEKHMPLLVKLHDELCVQPQRAKGFDCPWTPEHSSIW